MTIVNRIRRLVKADAYALVESLEEPRLILQQALRDMEAELIQLESRLKTWRGRREELALKQQQWRAEITRLEEGITLAIAEKREDLARGLLRQKILLMRHDAKAVDALTRLDADMTQVQRESADKKSRYDEIRARAEAMQALNPHADDAFAEGERLTTGEASLEQEVELELLRRLRRSA